MLAGSKILDASDASGNITDEYIYFGGKRVAHRVVSTNALTFYAEDMLGSSRSMLTSTGTLCYDADFFPFGGEHQYANTCGQNYKFMGKERDTETGNDDFGARYYASAYGRFLSADWSSTPTPVPYANLTNPQTFNLYSIVSDNPESFVDLDGHFWLGTAANWESQPVASDIICWCTGDPQKGQSRDQAGQIPPEQKPDPNPSWDKTKPLPDDPSKLGPDWRKNNDHKHPYGEEYINDKTGEKIEWNKGRPGSWGPSSDRGKDGWHFTPDGGTRGKQLDPGATIKEYAPTVAKAAIIISLAAIGHAIIDSAPIWIPLLAL